VSVPKVVARVTSTSRLGAKGWEPLLYLYLTRLPLLAATQNAVAIARVTAVHPYVVWIAVRVDT
jgi:hypothetical protein